MRQRLLLLLLPLLMLLAQQGAAWHALSHYRASIPAGAAQQEGSKGGKPQPADAVCEQCLAFAGMADLATAQMPLLALPAFGHTMAPAAALHAAATEGPTARSRGPPLLF